MTKRISLLLLLLLLLCALAIFVAASSCLAHTEHLLSDNISLHDNIDDLDDFIIEMKDHPLEKRADDDFDYFLLSIEWPGSVCKDLGKPGCKVNPIVTNFTIHGLWPNRNEGPHGPFYCRDVPFKYDELGALIPRMRLMWADYLGDEKGFWAHEWNKHGTCAMSTPGFEVQNKYFSNTLNLMERLPVLRALEAAGIVPSETEYYDTTHITDVVSRMFGARVFMACHNRENFGELRLCYTKDLRPMNCRSENSRCANRVQFMPIKY